MSQIQHIRLENAGEPEVLYRCTWCKPKEELDEHAWENVERFWKRMNLPANYRADVEQVAEAVRLVDGGGKEVYRFDLYDLIQTNKQRRERNRNSTVI